MRAWQGILIAVNFYYESSESGVSTAAASGSTQQRKGSRGCTWKGTPDGKETGDGRNGKGENNNRATLSTIGVYS